MTAFKTAGVLDIERAVASAAALGDEERYRNACLAELYQLSLQHNGKHDWHERQFRAWDRKPRIIVPLPRKIITQLDRFIWSGQRAPKLQVHATSSPDDPTDVGPKLDKDQAEKITTFVTAMAKQGRLTQAMRQAGAKAMVTGSAAVIVGVSNGWVATQVIGGKNCYPEFAADHPWELDRLVIQYKFPRMERTGATEREVWHWYRREIDAEGDYTMVEQPVVQGRQAPTDWEIDDERSLEHGFGFCPVVWVRALPDCDDDVDGRGVIDPTLYPLFDAISYTVSRKQGAVEYGMEPQPWRRGVSHEEAEVLEKSPGRVWDLPGSDAPSATQPAVGFLETTGSGAQRGSEHLREMNQLLRDIVGVVDRDPEMSVGAISALALRMLLEPMIALASDLRGDFGEDGLAHLVVLALRACCVCFERGEGVWIPGISSACSIMSKAQMQGPWLPPPIEVMWLDFVAPSEADRQQRVDYTVRAEQGGIVSRATAVRHVAETFGVGDVAAEEEAIEEAEEERQRMAMETMTAAPELEPKKAPSPAVEEPEPEDDEEGD